MATPTVDKIIDTLFTHYTQDVDFQQHIQDDPIGTLKACGIDVGDPEVKSFVDSVNWQSADLLGELQKRRSKSKG